MMLLEPQIYAGLSILPKRRFLKEYKLDEPDIADKIFNGIAKAFDVETWQIKSLSRKQELVMIRFIVCHELKYRTRLTLKQIGVMIGHRDHSTVIYGLTMYDNLSDTHDKEFKKYLDKYKEYEERETIS